ncbi:MAG: SMEK domain-containing protein [Candidatus Wallbacteria bacterium]|nr:SMEK domain-containing protein [Candidatus Wallbacteria bacterium]
MNRKKCFDYIEEKLNSLAYRIESLARANLLDLNIHSEFFFRDLINLIFGWKLENVNSVMQNTPGIDLEDTINKIVVQVSSTNTKAKIESALSKEFLSKKKGYSFKFISIAKDARTLRTKTYSNPHGLVFDPKEDIFDISLILKKVVDLPVQNLEKIRVFLEEELGNPKPSIDAESNITAIIQLISELDLSSDSAPVPKSFEIEKKIVFNNLVRAAALIEEHKVYVHRIGKIYSEFDQQGKNKSHSVLNGIRRVYIDLDSSLSPDEIFFDVISNVIRKVQESANYQPMPQEELELYVQILVVDAFIRCKIFKNPSGENDACS